MSSGLKFIEDYVPGHTSDVIEMLGASRGNVAGYVFPRVGHITISVGVSHWPHCSASQTTVFKQADDMLYAAKHAGRNQVQVYPS